MSSRILKGQPDPDRPDSTDKESGTPRRGVIKQDVYSAGEEARRIRDEATTEAERIREEAQSLAEETRRRAEEEGYEAGMAEWTREITAFHRSRQDLLEESQSDMLKLAIKLSEKILGRALADPDAMGDLILKAIRGIQHEGRILVKVRAEDLDAALAQRPRLTEEIGQRAEIDIVPDSSIKLGGCQIETATGIIDARLETQLKVLERVLLDGKAQG